MDSNQSEKLNILLEDTSKSLNNYCEKLLIDLKTNEK